MGTQLTTGAVMPPIQAKDVDGNDADITASLAGGWGVILLYRGHW